MKLVFISAGLMPKRSGGLPAYVAEVREELLRRGHRVIYLDTHCEDSSASPRIEQSGELSYSFFNSGARLPFGGPLPAPISDIKASPSSKGCLLKWLEQIQPELIHFHETACLPLELVSELRKAGYKLLFSPQDYLALCPTIQLLRQDQLVCRLSEKELQCAQCVRAWPFAQLTPFSHRAEQALKSWQPALARRLARAVVRRIGPEVDRIMSSRVFSAQAYRSRRRAAIEHLRSFHVILCISKLQQELLAEITGCPSLFRQLYPSRVSYAPCRWPLRGRRDLPPLALESPNASPGGLPEATYNSGHDRVVRFVCLNANQASKGRDLLLREFRELRLEEAEKVELHLYGAEGANEAGIYFHGNYSASDLDAILSGMDVGIVPSIWPEAYGYVGPEMLTRGVPLVVSSAGAMVEYVGEGENGLFFDPAEPGCLKAAMKSLATQPDLLDKLKANAPFSTQGIVKFSSHVDQLESIYRELLCSPAESNYLP